MNKILIYTSNPDKAPRSMADVTAFANEKPKYRLANVEFSPISALRRVKAGDRIFTKKGNTFYILKAFDTTVDKLSGEDKAYVDSCLRKGMKSANITGVKDVTPFEDWCKGTSKEVINTLAGRSASGSAVAKTHSTTTMNKSIKETLLSKIKSQFLPTRVSGDDIRLTINGEVAVVNVDKEGNRAYRVISSTGEITEYPEALTLSGLPVFTISRPIADVKNGDVVCIDGKYSRVESIKGNRICTVGYNGNGRTKVAVKDFLLDSTTVPVVVSLMGEGANTNGINPLMLAMVMGKEEGSEFDLKDFILLQAASGNGANIAGNNLFSNPLMFLLLTEKGGDIDPMMFLLMGNNGGTANLTSNPLLLMSLLGDKKGCGKSDLFETLIMASAFGGGNGLNLGGLFGGAAAPAAPAVKKAPAAKKPAAKPAKAAKKVATAPAAEA